MRCLYAIYGVFGERCVSVLHLECWLGEVFLCYIRSVGSVRCLCVLSGVLSQRGVSVLHLECRVSEVSLCYIWSVG